MINNDSPAKEQLNDTLNQIRNLLKLDAGWNGYDSLAPNPDAIAHAEHWIARLYLEVADLGQVWIKPNVVVDADGEVVFE